jgi:hypothetical protein
MNCVPPVKSQISAHLNGMSWSIDSVQKWNRTPTPLLDAKDHHIPKLELFVEGCFHTRTHIVIQTTIIPLNNEFRKKKKTAASEISVAELVRLPVMKPVHQSSSPRLSTCTHFFLLQDLTDTILSVVDDVPLDSEVSLVTSSIFQW